MSTEIYEIANPSDKYTIKGDLDVCAVAVLFLGRGQYGLIGADGAHAAPIMFAKMDSINDWLKGKFGKTFDEIVETKRSEIADALDGVVIGDRALFESLVGGAPSPEEAARITAEWNDRERSSMNNIGKYAKSLANALRKQIPCEDRPTLPCVAVK